MKTIFLIVGESGSGKSTIASQLEYFGYKTVKSYTTRKPRPNDDTHIFIDESEVAKYRSDMLAYTLYNLEHYFATTQQVLEADTYVIDPQGVINFLDELKKKNINYIRPVVIYINVPKELRKLRMMQRPGGTETQADIRLLNDETEFRTFKLKSMFDYAIPNIDLKSTLLALSSIIRIERMEI